jgi:uncharacterized membrane protein
MIIILALITAVLIAFRLWARITAMDAAIFDLKLRVQTLEQEQTSRESPPEAAKARRPPAPIVSTLPVPPPKAPQPVVPQPAPRQADEPSPLPRQPQPVVTLEPPASVAPASVDWGASLAQLHSDVTGEAFETRFAARWLLYVGVMAIVIGIAYFEKLAIDNQWISATTRVIQGAGVGLLLVAGGLQFVRRGYRLYGQIVSGCGVAILYVSTYAAFNFYRLISQPAAFALMLAVTTLATWLANRQRSQALALVAVCGGFATPFLLPASSDAQAALFTYDAILIAGTMLLARRRDWPTLNVVSYAFTVMTTVAWATRFYTSDKYLTTEVFLTIFCAMFLYILHEIRDSHHPLARHERAILWTAPLLYYVVSIFNLWAHGTALLVYLGVLAAAGVIAGSRTQPWIRLAFWAATAVPLLLWSEAHALRAWLVPGLIAWGVVWILNLAGLFAATVAKGRRFQPADIAVLHCNGLAAFAGAYMLVEALELGAGGTLAAALAAVNGAIGVLILTRQRDEALHFAALAFTLLTIGAALQFEGIGLTSAWAAEGAVVAWLGLRERRRWLRAGGLFLFSIAIARLAVLQFSTPPAGHLLLVNSRALCALFVIVLTYALTLAHRHAGESEHHTATGIGLVTAKLLILMLAASEVIAHWTIHVPPPFEPAAQVITASFIVGAVIIVLGLRRRQEWMRAVGGATIALAGLGLLAIQLEPAPAAYVSILNNRAAAGWLAVVLLCTLAAVHRRLGDHLPQLPANVAVLMTSASLLMLSLLTSEIEAFWSARGAAASWSIAREGLHTIAWAGVGGFLVWLGLSNSVWWSRAIGVCLLAVAVVRLLALQSAGAEPAYIVVANARVLASLVLIALLYGLAAAYRGAGEIFEGRSAPSMILWLAGNVLTLTLFTSEITAYWQVRDVHAASLAADSHFAREMMLSMTWAIYATVLVVIGLKKRYAPIRYFAMTLFVVTIVKVAAIDLAELDRIYRVLSVIGLGVMLLLTSYLYQRISPHVSR